MKRSFVLLIFFGVSLLRCASAPTTPSDSPGSLAGAESQPISAASGRDVSSDSAAGQILEDAYSLSIEDPQRALSRFQEAVAVQPDLFVAHHNIGVMQERLSNLEAAEAAYRSALDISQTYYPSLENLCALLVNTARSSDAVSLLEGLIEKYPKDHTIINTLSSVLLARGDYKGAELRAREVLSLDEKNVSALVNLARVFYQRKQYQLSLSVLQRAVEIDQNYFDTYVTMGTVYSALDKKKEAVESYKKAIAIQTDVAEVHNDLGVIYIELEDFDGAVSELEQAIRLQPTNAQAYQNLGNAFKGQQKYTEAEQAYKKALELNEKAYGVIFNLGILHLDNHLPHVDKLKRWDIAQSYLTSYISQVGDQMSSDERKRVESWLVEVGKKRKLEKRRIEREERIKKREKKAEEEGSELEN